MSTLRLSLAVAIILAVGAPARLAQGQIVSGLNNGPHHGPFIEPDTFRPDFQFFAPADATNYEIGADRDSPRGWFFTYDRVYINLTRPETQVPIQPISGLVAPYALDRFAFVQENPSPWDGDFTWGNRLELGFVDCDDRGWDMVMWHIDGPNEDNSLNMIDRRLAIPPLTAALDNDPIDFHGLLPNEFLGTDVLAGDAPLLVSHSVNLAKMSGFEFNRILERQEFHNGGVFEPLIGVRYIQFRDFWRYRLYQRSDINQDVGGVDDTEFYTIEQNSYENNMLGGQLGMRIFKQTGHWNLSTEFRMFALQNWQFYNAEQDNYIWTDAIGAPPPGPRSPEFVRHERIVSHADNSEFVWGGELKMEAAYQLTRDINFRTGFVFLDLGRGVGRGRNLATNDQDVQMFGMTFGFTINK